MEPIHPAGGPKEEPKVPFRRHTETIGEELTFVIPSDSNLVKGMSQFFSQHVPEELLLKLRAALDADIVREQLTSLGVRGITRGDLIMAMSRVARMERQYPEVTGGEKYILAISVLMPALVMRQAMGEELLADLSIAALDATANALAAIYSKDMP